MSGTIYALIWKDGEVYPDAERLEVSWWEDDVALVKNQGGSFDRYKLNIDCWTDPYSCIERVVERVEDFVKENFDLHLADCRSMQENPEYPKLVDYYFDSAQAHLDDSMKEVAIAVRVLCQLTIKYKVWIKDLRNE